jgi:hypothetical protein
MTSTKPVKLRLIMTLGQFAGECMTVRAYCNQRLVLDSAGQPDQTSIELDLVSSLPLHLEFWLTGKDVNDTKVGANGEILEDKCVVIENLSIDGIWLKRWYLESRAFSFWDTADLYRSTNYFGTNGRAEFRIDQLDLLEFWLDTMCVDG